WISRRTPPERHRQLFDVLTPVLTRYPLETVRRALAENNKGASTQRLTTAVAKGEFATFVRTLTSRPGTDDSFVTAAFHLRRSGVRHTAVLTGRYLRNTVQDSRLPGYLTRARSKAPDSSGRDVLFGLTVIERRLQRMEACLTEIEGRLDAGAGVPDARASLGVDAEGRDRLGAVERL